MGETPERSRLGRTPWGLAGMLLLVVMVEGHVSRRALEFLDSDDWAYREAGRAAKRQRPGAEVLCFGDSLVKYGVLPGAVQARSGRRVYNLAIAGGQASADLVLLRRALDAGARPEAVVVDFFPPILKVPPRFQGTRWASLLSTAEAARLAWSSGDAGWFASVTLAGALPTLRGRGPIRSHVLAALEGKAGVWPFFNMVSRRQWSKNSGAQLMPVRAPVAGLTDAEADRWAGDFFGAFECADVNERAITDFLALAASREIPVYWVLPPHAPAVRSRCEASGHAAAHVAFVRRFQQRFPNLVVLDARSALDDPAGYFDPQHLGPEGAQGFSLALGDALRKGLSGRGANTSRWVSVSACRPEPLPSGVEDLDQSQLAIGNVPALRR